MPYVKRVGFLICFSLLMLSCAEKGALTGGPPDLVPPAILKTEPASRTLNFSGNTIKLEFSKYVDKLSLQNAIFISPNLGRLRFNWSGKEVEVRFPDSLRKNTTYILTIGTDLIDIRPTPNHLASSYSLPFSTGDNIDSCSFAGKVFNENPQGVLIWAYKLDSIKADTLNPAHTKPDFLTQTGKDGSFTLPYLSKGAYRLYAIRDQYKNLLYDAQVDEYGTLPRDLTLETDSSRITGLQFRLTKEDTAPPFIASARSIDKYHVLVHFSEQMDTASIHLRDVEVTDTLSNKRIAIGDLSFIDDTSTTMQLVTYVQDSGKTYRLHIAQALDLAGNGISLSGSSTIFSSDGNPDTLKPTLRSVNIFEGSRNVRPEDSVVFAFSEAVQRVTADSGFSLRDSSKKLIAGKFFWWGSARMAFIPDSQMQLGMPYTVKMVLDSVRGLSGNFYKDSTYALHFQIESESGLGTVEGTITDEVTGAKGNIILTMNPLELNNTRKIRMILRDPGEFRFERVPEGKYTMFGFRDSDGNGKFSHGEVFPWKGAERFSAFYDTLKVRARWSVEGVVLKIPKSK